MVIFDLSLADFGNKLYKYSTVTLTAGGRIHLALFQLYVTLVRRTDGEMAGNDKMFFLRAGKSGTLHIRKKMLKRLACLLKNTAYW